MGNLLRSEGADDDARDLVEALKTSAEESKKLRESNERLAKATAEAAEEGKKRSREGSRIAAAERERQQRWCGPGIGTDRLAKFTGADRAIGAVKAGPVGLVASAYLATAEALGKGATAMEIVSNSSLTKARRSEEFTKELVLGGAAIIHFKKALLNTADRIRQTERRFAQSSFGREQRYERERFKAQGEAEVFGSRASADARAGLRPTRPGVFDRSTLAGERAFQEDRSRLPLKDEMNRAGALARAAREEQGAEARVKGLEAAQPGLLKNLEAAKKRSKAAVGAENAPRKRVAGSSIFGKVGSLAARAAGGNRIQAERNEASRGVESAALEVIRSREELERSTTAAKEKGLAAVQKESAYRQAGINYAKNELALLQAKEATITSQATRFGMMDRYEQQRGLAAARLVKKYGVDRVAPSVRDAAAAVAPEYVHKRAREAAERNPVYKDLQREGFFEAGGIKGARGEVAKALADVAEKTQADAAKTADDMAGVVANAFATLARSLNERLKARLDEFEEGFIRRNNGGR